MRIAWGHGGHRRVVIVQASIRQYRVPFFEELREHLKELEIDLEVVYGSPDVVEATKADAAELEWGRPITNRALRLGQRTVYWQPCLKYLRGADLIIVEQASKLLLNYILFLRQITGYQRLAFWGHGKNLQTHRASPMAESIKRTMSRHVHWWFAYNDFSADIVGSLGYPKERITSAQNAIDSSALMEKVDQLTSQDLAPIRTELGLEGTNVCIYAGGLYSEKRLDYLISSCDLIRTKLSDFELIVLGGGPQLPMLVEAAEDREWLHPVGPRFGVDKVPYFALSKLFLLPGSVGLALLDAFALRTPLVTTAIPSHGPEIAYLRSGANGLVVENASEPSDYAEAVLNLLSDSEAYATLVNGCREASEIYTIEAMVDRFAAGVVAALTAPPLGNIS